jgi:hypothetical protein
VEGTAKLKFCGFLIKPNFLIKEESDEKDFWSFSASVAGCTDSVVRKQTVGKGAGGN